MTENFAVRVRSAMMVVTIVTLWCATLASPARSEVSFVREIAPILLKRCVGCHGDKANLGGYRAHTFQYLMKNGASGAAIIKPAKPEESELYQRIISKVESLRMPKSDDALSAVQVSLVRRWIAEGAKFDGKDPAASLKSLMGPREHPLAPTVYRVATPIMALAFAPGGEEVAIGGYNEVTLWNCRTGALRRRFQRLPQRIQAIAYSKDGKSMLVAGGVPGEYGELSRIDLSTGNRAGVLDTFPDIALSAAFNTEGDRIVAGAADGSVRVYDARTGETRWASRVHSDWVTSVSFSADGQFVASASRDMTVKVYEAATGALYTTYNGHSRQIGKYQGQAPVYAVQFASDSPLAYSAGGGKWVQIWDPTQAKAESGDAGDMEERFAKEGKTRYIPTGFTRETFALTVRDGQVFAASADGVVKQFDVASLAEIRSYKAGSEWLYSIDYDPVSKRVAVGSYDGVVYIWNSVTGAPLATFRAEPGRSTVSK